MSAASKRLASLMNQLEASLSISECSIGLEDISGNSELFNTAEMWELLSHDHLDTRRKLLELFRHPVFTQEKNISLDRERELAYERLKMICKNAEFLSVKDFLSQPTRIFAVHELTGYMDGSTATKMTVQFK